MDRGHTTGEREIDLDLEHTLLTQLVPPTDADALHGDDLMRALLLEQRRTNALLSVLAITTRFNRGNYDGPYINRRRVVVPNNDVVEIFRGRRFPAALRIEADSVIGPAPTLLISSDRGSIRGGDAYSLSSAREIRVLVAAQQMLYASITGAPADTTIIIKEARL